MRHPIDAVLFDFDYTLADSSRAVIECVNTALAGMGLPPAAEDEIRRTIGTSLPDTFACLAGESHRPRADEFRAHFRRRSDQVMVEWTEIFPYVAASLASLQQMGLRLAIVSTKFRHRIEATLRRERLLKPFETIIGGEDVAKFKPDPEGLRAALGRMGLPVDRALYVGDSVTDAETAHRAGARFLAVLSGTTGEEAFSGYEPVAFLRHVGELPEFLRVSSTRPERQG